MDREKLIKIIENWEKETGAYSFDLADTILYELAKEKPEKGKGHKCPFNKSCTCYLHYQCNDCETHAEFLWELEKPETLGGKELLKIIKEFIEREEVCIFKDGWAWEERFAEDLDKYLLIKFQRLIRKKNQ